MSIWTRLESGVDGLLRLYDNAMRLSLGWHGLRTYYSTPDHFLSVMNRRHWQLSPTEFGKLNDLAPVEVLAKSVVERTIKRRLRIHALQAAVVTFLCTLPTDWLMWPLMVVDIVNFQREVFLFSQEACMIYRKRSEYGRRERFHFDYFNLAMLAAKMIEPFVIRQGKNAAGFVARVCLQRGARYGRGPIRIAIRQIFKWFGIVVAEETLLQGFEMAVVVTCAVIAGFVSYWLFVPMAKRLNQTFLAKSEIFADKEICNDNTENKEMSR